MLPEYLYVTSLRLTMAITKQIKLTRHEKRDYNMIGGWQSNGADRFWLLGVPFLWPVWAGQGDQSHMSHMGSCPTEYKSTCFSTLYLYGSNYWVKFEATIPLVSL